MGVTLTLAVMTCIDIRGIPILLVTVQQKKAGKPSVCYLQYSLLDLNVLFLIVYHLKENLNSLVQSLCFC